MRYYFVFVLHQNLIKFDQKIILKEKKGERKESKNHSLKSAIAKM